MDVIIKEAVEQIRLDEVGPRRRKLAFPRLTQEVQGLYRDLRVDLGDLLVFYPEFLDVRTELAMHALFTRFEEGAIGLFDTNREICREAIAEAGADNCSLPWDYADNRPYLRSTREHAYALCRLKRPQEALVLACEVSRHDPEDHSGVKAVLARAHLQMGQYARVLELTGADAAVNTVELCLGKVLACIALGWQEEAFYTLAEAYRSWPAVVEGVIGDGESKCTPETLIYPVTEQEQAERYRLDYGELWNRIPGAVRFVRRFLGARA